MVLKQWRHFSYNYREGGIGQVGSKILTRIRNFFTNDLTVLFYRVSVRGYAQEPELQLTHKVADLAELKRIRYFKLLNFPEMIQERFERGHKCHAFYLDGEFVNLIWETKDALFVTETHSVKLSETMGLLDGFTVKEFRRRGINHATHIMVVHLAREAGYKYVVGAFDPANVASARTYRKSGYRHFMTVTLQRRFGLASLHVEPISSPFTGNKASLPSH